MLSSYVHFIPNEIKPDVNWHTLHINGVKAAEFFLMTTSVRTGSIFEQIFAA